MRNVYRWSCVSSEVAWSPRDGAQLVSFQGKLFLLGGWNQYAGERTDLAGAGTGSFESEVCSEVWCSDDGGSWYLAATAPWSGRHMHGAVVHDGHIWVIGAENGTPDDVWKSKDGEHWQLVAAAVPWPERGNQLVTVFDGSIWVMGGQTGAAGQSNFVADLKAGKPFPPAAPPLCDVWRTKDGLRGELMTDDAPWAPRGHDHRREWRRARSRRSNVDPGRRIRRHGRNYAEYAAIRPRAAAKTGDAPLP